MLILLLTSSSGLALAESVLPVSVDIVGLRPELGMEVNESAFDFEPLIRGEAPAAGTVTVSNVGSFPLLITWGIEGISDNLAMGVTVNGVRQDSFSRPMAPNSSVELVVAMDEGDILTSSDMGDLSISFWAAPAMMEAFGVDLTSPLRDPSFAGSTGPFGSNWAVAPCGNLTPSWNQAGDKAGYAANGSALNVVLDRRLSHLAVQRQTIDLALDRTPLIDPDMDASGVRWDAISVYAGVAAHRDHESGVLPCAGPDHRCLLLNGPVACCSAVDLGHNAECPLALEGALT
jgi:hypothetical protein